MKTLKVNKILLQRRDGTVEKLEDKDGLGWHFSFDKTNRTAIVSPEPPPMGFNRIRELVEKGEGEALPSSPKPPANEDTIYDNANMFVPSLPDPKQNFVSAGAD